LKNLFSIVRLCAGFLLILTAIAGTAYASQPVPEVDPTAAGAAIALAVGGYLVAISKFHRK
jgi:hypothetical protein